MHSISSEEFLLSTTYRYGVQMGVEDTAPRATGFYYWFAHDATWGSTGRLWLMEWDTVGGTWIYHEATCDNSQIPANEWMRASYWHDPNSGLIKGDVRLVSDNSLIIELAFAPQSVFGSDPLASVSVGVQELAWQYIDNVAVTHQMPTGDLNGDGVVDTADVDVLVEVLLGTDADPDHQRRADLNGDGAADGQDIQPFVDALLGG